MDGSASKNEITMLNVNQVVATGDRPFQFYTDKIAPYKGELEIWYQKHASLVLDFKLIFLTAWVILKPESDLPFRWLKGLPERPEYLK